MKRKLVGGTLIAFVILGSLALATAREQQDAEDKTLKNAGHAKVWTKIDAAPARENRAVQKEQPAAATEIQGTEKVEAAPIQQAQQDTPKTKELQRKLADAETSLQALQQKISKVEQGAQQSIATTQQKLKNAESAIQALQKKLAVSQQITHNATDLQKKLTAAESTVQQLKQQAKKSAQQLEQQAKESVQQLEQQTKESAQQLEQQAKKSARTIQDLHTQLATFQALTEQPLTITECDSLRAQVTGLEIIAREQLETLEQNAEEKNYWQLNKDLLLSKIKELQNSAKALEGKIRGLQRDLTAARQ